MSKSRPLWVVKIGSQILIDEGPLFVRSLIRDIAELKSKYHVDVLVVSSGAIASARMRLQKTWKTLPEKQALSALGQPMIMELYNLALQSQGLLGAQVLLTAADFRNSTSRKNLLNTIRQLLTWGVVPILNENDAIATAEIQFGDNDYLSSLVACELKAEKLILMTNVEGYFDRAPHLPGAQLIPILRKITPAQIKLALKAGGSSLGRGGVASKLQAAQKASSKKVNTHIVQGSRTKVLVELAKGLTPGTWIPRAGQKL